MIRKSNVREALKILNNLGESIESTCEEEKYGVLPFLDPKIIRNDKGGIDFDIHRKETHVNSYINKNSYNPPA